MAFKIEGKEMLSIFVITKCCWAIHSEMVRLGKHVHSKQKKTLPHKLCSFMSSLCACPASSASIECVFSTYDLVWSKIRKSLDTDKAEKVVKIYRLCRADEDNH